MVILAIGDVVGDPGMDILCRRLGRLQRQVGADLTVVNGENATGRGITPALAEDIFYAGADVITLGNHTFANRQICDYLDEQPHILRPLNFPAQQPGQGSVVAEVQGRRVCVANLQGRVGMDYNVSSPFSAADALLRETEADLFLLDFHAEATSEKLAMGYHLAGRRARGRWSTAPISGRIRTSPLRPGPSPCLTPWRPFWRRWSSSPPSLPMGSTRPPARR